MDDTVSIVIYYRVSDCSFLFFHRQIFRLFFSTLLTERPLMDDITVILRFCSFSYSLSACSRNEKIDSFQLMMLAGSDCVQLARRSRHSILPASGSSSKGAPTTGVARAFQHEVLQVSLLHSSPFSESLTISLYFQGLREEFLCPLCGEMENDLRVLTHKHLNVS